MIEILSLRSDVKCSNTGGTLQPSAPISSPDNTQVCSYRLLFLRRLRVHFSGHTFPMFYMFPVFQLFYWKKKIHFSSSRIHEYYVANGRVIYEEENSYLSELKHRPILLNPYTAKYIISKF